MVVEGGEGAAAAEVVEVDAKTACERLMERRSLGGHELDTRYHLHY